MRPARRSAAIRDVEPFLRIGASQYPSQRRDAPGARYAEDIATSVQGQQGATSGPHAERLTAKCSRPLRRRRRRVGGNTRNDRKRQGAEHGRVAWNRARLEHCVDGSGRPRNPGSIAAATEIRRASGVAGTTIAKSPGQIAVTGKGWVIDGKEFVPFDESTPSPDGKIWICRRSDHTRRCVFGPPPGS